MCYCSYVYWIVCWFLISQWLIMWCDGVMHLSVGVNVVVDGVFVVVLCCVCGVNACNVWLWCGVMCGCS